MTLTGVCGAGISRALGAEKRNRDGSAGTAFAAAEPVKLRLPLLAAAMLDGVGLVAAGLVNCGLAFNVCVLAG